MSDSRKPWVIAGRLKSKFPTRAGLMRHSAAWFLGTLLIMFATAPFIELVAWGRLFDTIMLTVVLGAAVLAVGGRRRTLILAIVLVMLVAGSRWLHHFWAHDVTYMLHLVTFLVFLLFVIFEHLRFILRSPQVNSEVLCAAVATYLILGLLWCTAYVLVAWLIPESFAGVSAGGQPLHGFEALYFSMITLTTTGYGDISPVSGPARMLAMLEAVTGIMFIAVLVARLVSGYASEPPK